MALPNCFQQTVSLDALPLALVAKQDGIKGRLREKVQLLTLISDITRVHNKLVSTGDKCSLTNFLTVMSNPAIARFAFLFSCG